MAAAKDFFAEEDNSGAREGRREASVSLSNLPEKMGDVCGEPQREEGERETRDWQDGGE